MSETNSEQSGNATGESDSDSEDFPPYAEVQGLMNLIGDSARSRVLAVMVGKHYTALKSTDIADLAGIHRSTVYEHVHALEDLNVVTAIRDEGGATRWQLNKDSDVAKTLGKLNYQSLSVDTAPEEE